MSDDSKPDIQLTDQIHLNNTMMWDFGLRSDQSENISAIKQKIKGQIHRSCCCPQTFQILQYKAYDILKCKNFFIGFLDELGNFMQKRFTF